MKKVVVIATGCFAVLTGAAIVAIPQMLPNVLSLYRSDISFAVATEKKEVFITIDDAPSASTTEVDPENWTQRIVNPKSEERSQCPRNDVSTVPT